MNSSNTISWKESYLASLGYQLFLLLCVALYIYVTQRDPAASYTRIVSAWDARYYLHIATAGYEFPGFEYWESIVFFPLYPLLISFTLPLVPAHIGALIISSVTSVIGHALFLKYLSETGYTRERAWRVYGLLLATPIGIYFCNIYTESLFLLETALFLFLLQRRSFRIAAGVGFCAALTRQVGVLFCIPYIWCLLTTKSENDKIAKLGWATFFGAGYLLYLLLNIYYFDTPWRYTEAMKTVWYKEPINPFYELFRHAINLYNGKVPSGSRMPFDPLDQAFTVGGFLLIILSIFRVRSSSPRLSIGLHLWAMAQILVIASQSFWNSNARYVALILPLYLFLEDLLQKVRWLYYLILLAGTALSLYGIALYTRESWIL